MDERQESLFRINFQKFAKWIKIRRSYSPLAKKTIGFMTSLNEDLILIDLGTGAGLLAIELSKLLPQARIIGLDPSADILEIAIRNASMVGISNFEMKLGRAEEIPIDSESVDIVITQSSFHEWENPKVGLSEVIRILKPEGYLILEDYNRGWLSGWKLNIFNLFHNTEEMFFTIPEIVDLLKKTGFEEILVLDKGLHLLVKASKPQITLQNFDLLNDAKI